MENWSFFKNSDAQECGRVVHVRNVDVFILSYVVVVLELSVPAVPITP